MYSNETLKKLMGQLKKSHKLMSEKSISNIKMCISSGNRKIGRVMNVSLPPIMTCGHCKQCKHYCYDVKACIQYPDTVIDARIRNYTVLIKDREEYFHRIDMAMSRKRKNKYFRWHVAGEIMDIDYFDRMIKNAVNHPDFIIWTYTKEYTIVNEWIKNHGDNKNALPANFTVMFSEWRGLEMVNPYNLPEFRVVMKNDVDKPNPKKVHYCPGNCDICKKLNRGCVAGETSYANEH